MQYELTYDSFFTLPYTAGTVQNICERATVEICANATGNSGLTLKPNEKFQWSGAIVYARAKWDDGEVVKIAVVPFKQAAGGGGGGGTAATVDVGSTATGSPGTNAKVTNVGNTINAIFDFVIPRGADGAKGADGQDGKSFTISAQYPTKADLIADHPTGTTSEAYLVGTTTNPDLYLWILNTTTNQYEWTNVGPIAGVKGDPGVNGVDGVSPTVSVTGGNYGIYTLTVSDANGTAAYTLNFQGSVNDWQSSYNYMQYNFAVYAGELYLSLSTHTSSGDFMTDLAAGKWRLLGGTGTGILDTARAWAMGANSPSNEIDTDSPTGLTQSSKTWAETSKSWAVDITSPDSQADTDSPTGLTQSSRTWALIARQNGIAAEQYAAQTATNIATTAWSATATYNYPDVVHYTDGYSYRCVGYNIIGDVPGISQNWVCLSRVTSAAWEYDTNGGMMPVINPVGDSNWELDLNGALMPTT